MSDADSVDVGWGAAVEAERKDVPGRLWQVNTRGRKVVEMKLEELSASVKSGKLGARTLVWCEGMPAWTPLGEVPELERLTRDSAPPASGARFIGDESEPLAGTKSYVSLGSEPPTDPGTLAIYERPLATIEFPDAIEAVPESVDEPTPAFGAPGRPSARVTLPGLAPEDLVPLPSSTRSNEPPPAPPMPPRGASAFPAPVTSSPLGAVLSSMVGTKAGSTPVPGSGRSRQLDVPTSYAVAKATPMPTAALKLSALASYDDDAPSTPKPFAPSAPSVAPASAPSSAPKTPAATAAAAPAPKPFAETMQSREPPKPVVRSVARSATTMPRPTAPSVSNIVSVTAQAPLPSSASLTPKPLAPSSATATPKPLAPAATPSAPLTPQPELAGMKSATQVPPRPAIEFLPPIIVQEKEDDEASIITLPLPARPPLDADFHESTLVLAGRRRPRRWVPLGAAVAAAIGSACLASTVTYLAVGNRAPETRIVEKKVFVAAPATTAASEPEAHAAPPAAAARSEQTRSSPSAEPEKRVASEHVATKTETNAAPVKASRKDDASGLAQSSTARRELRAGFPTNPGF
jgi:hypothetical protein